MAYVLNYRPDLPNHLQYGIGCIGSGFIMADCHLVAYRNAGLNPVAITGRNLDRVRHVAERHSIPACYTSVESMLDDEQVEIVDIAVPPDVQIDMIRTIVSHRRKVKGILAQKPLGVNYCQASEIVRLCEQAKIPLAVNQNMRYDQSVRSMKSLLNMHAFGEPIFATIDMRAIPHWMPWQEHQGWVTLRIMSIHHLDTFRYWFGNPIRIFASTRKDPRTLKRFEHSDGICAYILEYADGMRACSWDDVWAGPALEGAAADSYIRWRVEGSTGMARGTIGWPEYPKPTPSTIEYTTIELGNRWISPAWNEVWFPDAFLGTMTQLMCAIEQGREPELSGRDNLQTMALVEAAYRSADEHRAVEIAEIHP